MRTLRRTIRAATPTLALGLAGWIWLVGSHPNGWIW